MHLFSHALVTLIPVYCAYVVLPLLTKIPVLSADMFTYCFMFAELFPPYTSVIMQTVLGKRRSVLSYLCLKRVER